MNINEYKKPIITTGKPITTAGKPSAASGSSAESDVSFQEVLLDRLKFSSNINFSKHAVDRVCQRNVDITSENLQRLNSGVKIAEDKGLNDTLILIDNTAYIVNIRNNKVVTTINGEDLVGSVFTNIDGTVIV